MKKSVSMDVDAINPHMWSQIDDSLLTNWDSNSNLMGQSDGQYSSQHSSTLSRSSKMTRAFGIT